MDSIPPGRLLTLVRPGNDLILRRIRNLKSCAQACGCNITTPRYACNLPPGCISSKPTFARLRKKTKKRRKKKWSRKKGPKKGKRVLAALTNGGLPRGPHAGLVVLLLHSPHGAVQDKAALSLLQKRHLTCLRQCLRAIFPELRRC